MKNNPTFAFRCSDLMLEQIKKVAKEKKITTGEVIRQCVAHTLEIDDTFGKKPSVLD